VEWAVLHGVVYVARARDLARYKAISWFGEETGPQSPLSPKDAAVLKTLRGKVVSLDFSDTPLETVIGFLREVSKVNLVLTPEARTAAPEAGVTLKIEELPLDQALRLILMPHNLHYRVDNGVVIVDIRDASARVAMRTGTDYDFVNVSLTLAVEFLAGNAGLPVSFAPGAREIADRARVTRKGRDVPVEKALADVLADCGFEYGILNGAIVIDRKKGN
jgi:hypothetical protein